MAPALVTRRTTLRELAYAITTLTRVTRDGSRTREGVNDTRTNAAGDEREAAPRERARGPRLAGRWASHPAAHALAHEAAALQLSYARVVAELGLCPFLKDAESGLGELVVVLSSEPTVTEALDVAAEAGLGVVHLVYPLATLGPREWERFGGEVAAALQKSSRNAPALAAFHPEMAGDAANPHRAVGLLRRSPDPFLQLVPPDLAPSGTVVVTELPKSLQELEALARFWKKDHATSTFERLGAEGLVRLCERLTELRDERTRRYAPHLEALARA